MRTKTGIAAGSIVFPLLFVMLFASTSWAHDLTPKNASRPYVRIMRFWDPRRRSDHGEETTHGGADHQQAA